MEEKELERREANEGMKTCMAMLKEANGEEVYQFSSLPVGQFSVHQSIFLTKFLFFVYVCKLQTFYCHKRAMICLGKNREMDSVADKLREECARVQGEQRLAEEEKRRKVGVL